MVQGYYKPLTDLLKKEAGAYYIRNNKGGHEKWSTADGRSLNIPHPCKSRHTANGILEDAGLKKRF